MWALVNKELSERASKKGTHRARVFNCGLLRAGFFVLEILRRWRSESVAVLGGGEQLFSALVWTQWGAMMVLVPLAMGSIAIERERQTWGLLLLTNLRPGEIIWQKFVAGLIPALSSVLLLLPLGALCYAIGGLETMDVHFVIMVLAIAACSIGALALFCSSLCQTSMGAFLLTLLLAAICNAIPVNGISSFHMLKDLLARDRDILGGSLVALLYSGGLLVAARSCLFRSTLPSGRRVLRRLFEKMDGLLERRMPLLKRRRILINHRLMLRHPVAWRELSRRSLCQTRHLVCLVLPGVALVLAYAIWADRYAFVAPQQTMPLLMGLLWIGSLLLLTVEAATMVAKEKEDQTLEVLLTTPIPARTMVLQKAMALRRLAAICLMILMTGAVASVAVRSDLNPWIYLSATLFEALVFFPVAYWLGFLVGARARSRVQAAGLAVGVELSIHVVGLLPGFSLLMVCGSPALTIIYNEQGSLSASSIEALLAMGSMHYLVACGFLLGVRWCALWYANHWLGRPSHSLWVNPEESSAPAASVDAY